MRRELGREARRSMEDLRRDRLQRSGVGSRSRRSYDILARVLSRRAGLGWNISHRDLTAAPALGRCHSEFQWVKLRRGVLARQEGGALLSVLLPRLVLLVTQAGARGGGGGGGRGGWADQVATAGEARRSRVRPPRRAQRSSATAPANLRAADWGSVDRRWFWFLGTALVIIWRPAQ